MTADTENPRSVVDLAEDTRSGADSASGLPVRLARYSEARRSAICMQSFAATGGHVKEAAKLKHCADYLVFRHYYTVDKVRLHAANFCKQTLLCPMCAIRRGSKMLQAYLERFEVLTAERPTLRPYLVTVTVKNGDDLAERLRHLRSALKRMGQARRNARKGRIAFVEFARSEGGFHSIEVTNKGKGWHPHAHMIWLCESEPNQATLADEWQTLTRDSHVVDVRPLHDPVDGFIEVCKYALKFSDLSLADNWHAYEVMRRSRLIDSHGCMRGVEVPEDLTETPLDELPFFDLFYRYFTGAGYALTEAPMRSE